jgi:spermidine/putrescine transport system substrate-binding protein
MERDTPLPVPFARGMLTRRTLLRGAGAVALGAFLASCGTSGTAPKSSQDRAAQDRSDEEKVVNWSNWPEYIDVDDATGDHPTLAAFTAATGIKVHYTEDYNDNDEFFAKVRPQLSGGQDTGRDVWCSTDWLVARLIRLGWVQELDKANIPNADNLQDNLKDVQFDRGRKYSLPWQSGFTGIGFNPVAFTDADFEAAMGELQKAKDAGQFRGFTGNDYTSGLASGEIAAALAWTGDVVQLKADNPNLGYTLPSTGHMLWSDNFVIPNQAQHKKNAERLIDYYYDPANMALVADYVNYLPPVKGTKEKLVVDDPDVAGNPLIFPSDDVLAASHVFRGLTEEEETRYNQMFQSLIGA